MRTRAGLSALVILGLGLTWCWTRTWGDAPIVRPADGPEAPAPIPIGDGEVGAPARQPVPEYSTHLFVLDEATRERVHGCRVVPEAPSAAVDASEDRDRGGFSFESGFGSPIWLDAAGYRLARIAVPLQGQSVTVELARTAIIDVQVMGASAQLLERFELRAGIRFDESEVGAAGRRVFHASGRAAWQSADATRVRLERPFDADCEVELIGTDRRSGRTVLALGTKRVSRSEHSVLFDLTWAPIEPTAQAVLRVRIRFEDEFPDGRFTLTVFDGRGKKAPGVSNTWFDRSGRSEVEATLGPVQVGTYQPVLHAMAWAASWRFERIAVDRDRDVELTVGRGTELRVLASGVTRSDLRSDPVTVRVRDLDGGAVRTWSFGDDPAVALHLRGLPSGRHVVDVTAETQGLRSRSSLLDFVPGDVAVLTAVLEQAARVDLELSLPEGRHVQVLVLDTEDVTVDQRAMRWDANRTFFFLQCRAHEIVVLDQESDVEIHRERIVVPAGGSKVRLALER